MILRLVAAELRHRPARAVLLLVGYALGVAVMVVLLAVGEAMLTQARDHTLIGGGDLVMVPAGVSPEMLKAGGATSLYFGLDQARFLQRHLLESPRARDLGVVAASPIIDGRLVQLARGERRVHALATGEIPGRAEVAGAGPDLLAGAWTDSPADRDWASPDATTLYNQIDRFHLPYASAVGDSTWGEWHYFNVTLDAERWIYLSYMVGGRVGVPGEWGGRLLLTTHDPRHGYRTFQRDVTDIEVQVDTSAADLSLGDGSAVRQRDGVYHLLAEVEGARIDLEVAASPHRLFPPASLGSDDFVSGYVVPALHARATGDICLPNGFGGVEPCARVEGARAYHDHNWGSWREVSWDWGTASDEDLSLLYGRVRGPESRDEGLFVYLVDGRGPRGLYRAPGVEVIATTTASVDGEILEVPTRLRFEDARRGFAVEIEVDSYQVTEMERDRYPWFVQMRGVAVLREGGEVLGRLDGSFETYLDRAVSPAERER